MNNSLNKIIAPIIITLLLVAYFTAYLLGLVFVTISFPIKIVGGLILLAFIGLSIYVLIERIKEIRSGDEDDLSKY